MKLDKRVSKTRKAIENALIELMGEKSFSEITVKNIVDRAQISRSTFYDHFVDKIELFDSMQRQFMFRFLKVIRAYFFSDSKTYHMDFATNIMEFVLDNAEMFEMLIKYTQNDIGVIERINAYIEPICHAYLKKYYPEDNYGLGYSYVSRIYTSVIMISVGWIVENKNQADIEAIHKFSLEIQDLFFKK